MSKEDVIRRLSELTRAALDMSAVGDICRALEEGRLTPDSTSVIRSEISQGRVGLEDKIRSFQILWATEFPGCAGDTLALALRASADAALLERLLSSTTQVVWTGPKVKGSYVRATREVVRELVRGAKSELLVVGYWLAARDDGEGIIEELIELLSTATLRGVEITVVLDERQRPDGANNRQILISVWPSTVSLPKLLTWRLPPDDRHLKLHAKVIVADQRDGLVTSANLTRYAMDRNMEMGVRITGQPAATIAQHFRLLDSQGTLEPF